MTRLVKEHAHRADEWAALKGGLDALRYALRDLEHLEAICRLCRARRVVVQAGGNLGVYPKRLAEIFETVYTFEPAGDLFVLLTQNAPEPNVLRFQAALGCERQLVGVSRTRRDGKPNAHEGITHVQGAGPIPTLQLDDLALPVCDLVALDVEGFEYYALRGARETLRRCRPLVAIEINKSLDYVPVTRRDIETYLAECGYGYETTFGQDAVFTPLEWRRQ